MTSRPWPTALFASLPAAPTPDRARCTEIGVGAVASRPNAFDIGVAAIVFRTNAFVIGVAAIASRAKVFAIGVPCTVGRTVFFRIGVAATDARAALLALGVSATALVLVPIRFATDTFAPGRAFSSLGAPGACTDRSATFLTDAIDGFRLGTAGRLERAAAFAARTGSTAAGVGRAGVSGGRRFGTDADARYLDFTSTTLRADRGVQAITDRDDIEPRRGVLGGTPALPASRVGVPNSSRTGSIQPRSPLNCSNDDSGLSIEDADANEPSSLAIVRSPPAAAAAALVRGMRRTTRPPPPR